MAYNDMFDEETGGEPAVQDLSNSPLLQAAAQEPQYSPEADVSQAPPWANVEPAPIEPVAPEPAQVTEPASGPNWQFPEKPRWAYGEGAGTSPAEGQDPLNPATKTQLKGLIDTPFIAPERVSPPNAWGVSTPQRGWENPIANDIAASSENLAGQIADINPDVKDFTNRLNPVSPEKNVAGETGLPEDKWWLAGDIGSGAAAAVKDIISMAVSVPRAITSPGGYSWAGEGSGDKEGRGIFTPVANALTELENKYPTVFKPTEGTINTWYRRWIYEGIRSFGPSIASMLAGAKIGSMFGPGGTLAGGAVGAAIGTIPFFFSEFDRFMEEGRQQGKDFETILPSAAVSGMIEWGGESVGNLIGAKIFGFDKAALAPFKKTIKESLERGLGTTAKGWLTNSVKDMPVEAGTEYFQQLGESALRVKEKMESGNPWDEAASVIGPTIVMTLLGGSVAAKMRRSQKAAVEKSLIDPQESPENRYAAVNAIGASLKEHSPELAQEWSWMASDYVDKGLAIPIDIDTFETISNYAAAGGITAPAQQATPGAVITDEQGQQRTVAFPEHTNNFFDMTPAELSAVASFDKTPDNMARFIDMGETVVHHLDNVLENSGIVEEEKRSSIVQAFLDETTDNTDRTANVPLRTLLDDILTKNDIEPATFWELEQKSGGRLFGVKPQSTTGTITTTGEIPGETEPSDEQKDAQNYPKGHGKLFGLDISVENAKGTMRKSKTDAPEKWETLMNHDYGYILGYKGADKDHIDFFAGDNPEASNKVFVVDQRQVKKGGVAGGFDEHKIMLGFDSKEQAMTAYRNNYQPGWNGLMGVTEMGVDEFKNWLETADKKKPAAETFTHTEETPQAPAEIDWKKEAQNLGVEFRGYYPDKEGKPFALDVFDPVHGGNIGIRLSDNPTPEMLAEKIAQKRAEFEAAGGEKAAAEDLSPEELKKFTALTREGKSAQEAADIILAERNQKQQAPEPKQTVLYSKKEYTLVGKNSEGVPIYQSEEGFRLTATPEGILMHEPVGMRPTRDGIITQREERSDEYFTVEELEAKKQEVKPEEPKGLKIKEYEGQIGNKQHITRDEEGHIDTEKIVHLLGEMGERRGEHRNRKGKKWEEFKEDIKKNGIKSPILILKDPGKKAVISEGNHRLDAAVELGLKQVPVEIRYFGHSEREGLAYLQEGETESAPEKSYEFTEPSAAMPDIFATDEDITKNLPSLTPAQTMWLDISLHKFSNEQDSELRQNWRKELEKDSRDKMPILEALRSGEPLTPEQVKTFSGILQDGKDSHKVFIREALKDVAPEKKMSEMTEDDIDAMFDEEAKHPEAVPEAGDLAWHMAWMNKYDEMIAAVKNLAVKEEKKAPEKQPAEQQTGDIGTIGNINRPALARIFLQHIVAGEKLNRVQLQKITAEALGIKPAELTKNPHFTHKELEESVEYALVQRSRQIIEKNTRENVPWQSTFNELWELYDNQPLLSSRTSSSIQNQAYSTPLHIAYLMQVMTGVDENTTVYEPTAGTGFLLTAANPENVLANELQKPRARLLEDQGFTVTQNNGETNIRDNDRQQTFDVVEANPPFGAIKTREVDGYRISKLEHAIMIDALSALKNNGRGAFIVGGHNFTEQQIVSGKMSIMPEHQKVFLNWLYHFYNVQANIDVSGKAYGRQGTQFDFRIIVVDGRKETPAGIRPLEREAYLKAETVEDLIPIAQEVINGQNRMATEGTEGVGQRPQTPGSAGAATGKGGPKELPGMGGPKGTKTPGEKQGEGPKSEPGTRGPAGGGVGGGKSGGPAGGAGGAKNKPGMAEPGSGNEPIPEGTTKPGGTKERTVPGGQVLGAGQPEGIQGGTGGTIPAGVSPGVPTIEDAKNAESALDDIFGVKGPTKVSMTATKYGVEVELDPAIYAKAKPHFKTMYDKAMADDILPSQFVAQVVERFKGGTVDVVPYLKHFWKEQKALEREQERLAREQMSFTDQVGALSENEIDEAIKEETGEVYDTIPENVPEDLSPELESQFIKGIKEKLGYKQFIKNVVEKLGKAIGAVLKRFMLNKNQDIKLGVPQTESQQTSYRPTSKGPILTDTLIPITMRRPIEESLKRIEDEVGPVDDYVREQLQYKDSDRLWKAMDAAQVDAVAMSIYNYKKGKGIIVGDQTGFGKGRSQPLDSKLLAKSGWIRMGDVRLGNKIINEYGTETKVIGIYPQGEIDVYEIAFSDGSKTQCSLDHLWLTINKDQKYWMKSEPDRYPVYAQWKIHTTKELIGKIKQVNSIPLVSAVEFDKEETPIDAYLLGVLLGDACIRQKGIELTCADDDILTAVNKLLPINIVAKKGRQYHYQLSAGKKNGGRPNALLNALRSLELTGKTAPTKFIPEIYKFNSTDIRLAMLQGLLDTDGTVGKTGSTIYYTVSERLADDVIFLVQSLGGTATKGIKKTNRLDCYVIGIKLPNGMCPFRLERKRTRCKDWTKYHPQRTIKSITAIGKKQCQCIQVDNPSGLYVTDDFIVTHNTAAAMYRYAKLNGTKTVFFTEKPNLFSDFYRDIVDTDSADGFDPFIIQTGALANIRGKDTKVKYLAPTTEQRKKLLHEIVRNGIDAAALKDKTLIVTTYSQIMNEGMNLQKQALQRISEDVMFIFDEAHNAAGSTSNTGSFIRNIIAPNRNPQGVLYMSATFAKRPDSCGVYFRTALGVSNMSASDLTHAISRGGTPLQEWVTNALAKVGQYVRRELSYENIKVEAVYDVEHKAQDAATADQNTAVLRQIVNFDRNLADVIDTLQDQEATAVLGVPIEVIYDVDGTISGKQGGRLSTTVTTSNFASTVHNAVRQLLLSMKTDMGVRKAIEELTPNADNPKGRKVVIGISNTMGSFVSDAIQSGFIQEGQPFNPTFNDVLEKYLRRTLSVNVTSPTGKTSKRNIPVSRLPAGLQQQYNSIINQIRNLKSEIPGSPIDSVKLKLTKAGFKVAEITNRDYEAYYAEQGAADREPTLRKRTEYDKKGGRNDIINKFNSGQYDVLIINAAGASGISVHASKDFKDNRPRTFIGIQTELNIDTEIQKMGRVNRKNQIHDPRYFIMALDIPTEIRPLSVHLKKMKSLNASVSANAQSVFVRKELPDMLNKYGDTVVRQWFQHEIELLSNLNISLEDSDLMHKVTGKLAILPTSLQQRFYEEVESEYNALIDDLKETGEYDLETTIMDLSATTTSTTLLAAGNDETTPLGQSSWLEQVNVKLQEKLFKTKKINELTEKHLQGKSPDKFNSDIEHKVREALDSWIATKQTEMEALVAADPEKAALHQVENHFHTLVGGAENSFNTIQNALEIYKIGNTYEFEGGMLGVLIDVKYEARTGNPAALSKLKFTFATDYMSPKISISLSKIYNPENPISAELYEEGVPSNWDEQLMGGERNIARYIITGNLLQGYKEARSGARMIRFTDNTGKIREGILMPLNFNPADITETVITAEQSKQVLEQNVPLRNTDETILLSPPDRGTGNVTVWIKYGKDFQTIYTDPDLMRLSTTGEFEKTSRLKESVMRATMTAENARIAIDRFYAMGNSFSMDKNVFTRIFGQPTAAMVAQPEAPYGDDLLPKRFIKITEPNGKTYFLGNVKENDKFIQGYEVNKDGDRIEPKGSTQRMRIVEKSPETIRFVDEYRQSKTYGTLERLPATVSEAQHEYENHLSSVAHKFLNALLKAEEGTVSTTTGALPGPKTLGIGFKRILDDILNRKPVSFNGAKLETAYDLAALAETIRNPHFETLYMVPTNDKGEALATIAISTRLPGEVVAFIENQDADLAYYRSMFKTMGATGYYMLHNHPSGDVEISSPDHLLTRLFEDNLTGFQGHVVINHNKYSLIQPRGELDYNAYESNQEIREIAGKDELLTPELPHPLLGKVILDENSVVQLGKQIEAGENNGVLFFRSGPGVRAIEIIPLAVLKRVDLLRTYMDKKRIEYGSSDTFLYIPKDKADMSLDSRLTSQGIFTDIVFGSGFSFRQIAWKQPDYMAGHKDSDYHSERMITFSGNEAFDDVYNNYETYIQAAVAKDMALNKYLESIGKVYDPLFIRAAIEAALTKKSTAMDFRLAPTPIPGIEKLIPADIRVAERVVPYGQEAQDYFLLKAAGIEPPTLAQQNQVQREVENNPTNENAVKNAYNMNTWESFWARYYTDKVNKKGFDAEKFYLDTGVEISVKDSKDLYAWTRKLQTMQDFAHNFPEMRRLGTYQDIRIAEQNQADIKDRRAMEPFYDLDKKLRQPVNKALEDGDLENRIYSNSTLASRFGLNKEQQAGYWAVRTTLGEKLQQILSRMVKDILPKEFKHMTAPVLRDINRRNSALSRVLKGDPNYRNKILDIKNNFRESLQEVGMDDDLVTKLVAVADWGMKRRAYMPHDWKSNWLVRAVIEEPLTDDDGEPMFDKKTGEALTKDVVYMFDVPTVAGNILPSRGLRQLAARGAAAPIIQKLLKDKNVKSYKVVRATDLPVDLFEGVRPGTMKSIIDSATEKVTGEFAAAGDGSAADMVRKSIKEDLEQLYMSRGWGRHLIPRKGVLGYRTDFEQVLASYLTGFNAYMAKANAAKGFSDTMQTIDPRKTPEMWESAKEYISDMLGGSRGEAGPFKTVVGTFYLAGDVSAAVLNLTQNWTHANALLKALYPRKITKGESGTTVTSKSSLFNSEAELAKAMKDIATEYASAKKSRRGRFIKETKNIKKNEIDFLRWAYERGSMDPKYFGEVTNIGENKIYMDYADKAKRSVFFLFTGSEAWNRTSTLLAAYRMALKAGHSEENSRKVAEWVTREAHFDYGRGNRPELIRKAGTLGNIAYTFMTYPINNLVFLKHRLEDLQQASSPQEKAIARKIIGANLAYLFAFGGLNALPFAFLAKIVYNLFTDPEDDYEKLLHKYLGQWTARTAVRGLPASTIGNDMSWRVEGTDVLGLPIGLQTAKGIYKRYQRAAHYASENEYTAAFFHAMPDMMVNPYKAFMGYTKGGTIDTAPPIKYTAGEAINKALGFSPVRESEAFKVAEITKRKHADRTKQLDKFAEAYIQARVNKNMPGMATLRKDVTEYNRAEHQKGRSGIPIPWADVQKSAKTQWTARQKSLLEKTPKNMARFEKEIGQTMELGDVKYANPYKR